VRQIMLAISLATEMFSDCRSSSDCDRTNLDWQRSSSEKSGRCWRWSPTWRRRREINRMMWLWAEQQCRPLRAAATWRWSRRTATGCRIHSLQFLLTIASGL